VDKKLNKNMPSIFAIFGRFSTRKNTYEPPTVKITISFNKMYFDGGKLHLTIGEK